MHEYITPSSTIFIKMNYTCMLIRCDLANKIIISNNISNVMLSGRIKKVIIHFHKNDTKIKELEFQVRNGTSDIFVKWQRIR